MAIVFSVGYTIWLGQHIDNAPETVILSGFVGLWASFVVACVVFAFSLTYLLGPGKNVPVRLRHQ